MDYREDLYPKIPFYMAYPASSMYLTEMEYEKDMDRMKTYFPAETKTIMEMVEKRLDEFLTKLHDGSGEYSNHCIPYPAYGFPFPATTAGTP